MANEPKELPRNRDLEQPQRTGETIQPIVPSKKEAKKPDRTPPLPEEETYERDTPSVRRE